MALSYELFAIIYSMTILSATIAALFIFIGPRRIRASILLLNVRKNWVLISCIILLPFILLLESRFPPLFDPETLAAKNVSWMLSHGGELINYIQSRLESGLITDAFIFIYVWVFTFIIYFTPIYLLASNDSILFRKYSVAMILNYLFLLPFYTFFPVSVTSYVAATGLKPLLYIQTHWGRLVTSMDPLDNSFPSGHISLLLTTLLILFSSYHHRKYTHFVMWGVITITVAVLYLGIHWIVDIIGGIALAVFVILIVGNTRFFRKHLSMTFSEFVEERKIVVADETHDGEILPSEKSGEERITRIFRKTR